MHEYETVQIVTLSTTEADLFSAACNVHMAWYYDVIQVWVQYIFVDTPARGRFSPSFDVPLVCDRSLVILMYFSTVVVYIWP